MEKEKSARIRANEKYDKANTIQFCFKFNKKTDKAIIEKLQSVPNRQGYIKDLILSDLNRPTV